MFPSLPFSTTKSSSPPSEMLEASYQENVTELFLAIEEMEWRDAFDIIQSNHKQVKTWIKSTATASTTFNWSVWRRLPIHEACMRRAPAWLISELLSKYPQSAACKTNLGELPLHLAVDKACAPEVVNLIIVANWNAIMTEDQAGRTPIDIIDREELLQVEDYRIIFESLSRCRQVYMDIQRATQDTIAAIKRKQKATSNAMTKRHQEELKLEYDKQRKLSDDVDDLKKEIKQMKVLMKSKDAEIQKHLKQKEGWVDAMKKLETKVECQQRELESEKSQMKILQNRIERKDEEILNKDTQIDILSKDLTSIAVLNDTDVMEVLIETEQSMRTMVSNQIALQKLLNSKSKKLKNLLNERGIAVPKVENAQRSKDQILLKEKKADDQEDYEDQEASAAVMAAAMVALKPQIK